MNIGQAAEASGVSAKMLRYYEAIHLLPGATRSEAGYRTYSDRDVQTLRFVRHARDLGLPLERIKELIGLWQDGGRESVDVKRIAEEHIAELEDQIARLTRMAEALKRMAEACHGDHRPECPILDALAAGSGHSAAASQAAYASRTRRTTARSGFPTHRGGVW